MAETQHMSQRLPSPADLRAARRRIAGRAVPTPLLPAPGLSAVLDRPVFLKPECLQRTGSFKFRGACNRIAALEPAFRAKGVVAFSSGNHAQGVAAAAQMFGIAATIVMPSDAPRAKIEGTRSYGARVVLYDRATESREAIGARIAEETGATLVPPFDDPFVIAGQSTIGFEIVEAVAAIGLRLDALVTPLGGGGLASGLALALEQAAPDGKLYGAEPAGFDDAARSLATGAVQRNTVLTGSVQDSLLSPSLGVLTWAVLKSRLADVFAVTDAEALSASAYAALTLKLTVEPGGAAALAAVRKGALPEGDGALVIVLSGGNMDAEILAQALSGE
jgi:threonine dehydratase